MLPLGLLGAHLYAVYINEQDLIQKKAELDDYISDLEVSLNLHLNMLDSLDSFIRSGDPDSQIENFFHEFSKYLIQSAPGLEGIIVLSLSDHQMSAYPEELYDHIINWEEQVEGIPQVQEGMTRMMETGTEEIMGPFEFDNGGYYTVAAQSIMNGSIPWGYQALVLNMTSILSEAGFLEPDFPFHLQIKNHLGETFFGGDLSARDDLIYRDIQVRNVEWEIVAKSKESWTRETTTLLLTFISGEVIISILVGIVAFSIAYSQGKLNKLVVKRTEELEERSTVLSEEIEKRKRSQDQLAKANLGLEISLKEVNSLLKLSRLHLEGHEGLGEVFGKAVKIIEHTLLEKTKLCAIIRFDRNNYTVSCQPPSKVLHVSKIFVNGKERGAIEIRSTSGNTGSKSPKPSKREMRIFDSIAGQLGAIAERWIAQQKEMEAKAQAQFYLDLMSHDINNMHQGILINLEMEKMGRGKGKKRPDTISTTMDLIHRSIKLVSNVKLLSYLKDLKEPLKAVEINGSIVESVKEVKASFPGREVEILMDMSADRMYVMADRLVSEVFINILNNGIKVQKTDQAKMKIEVFPNHDRIRVAISDHGPGIRDSDKGSLFERHTGVKHDKLMSGIGLSLVQVLMNRYRGRVWIEDRIRGKSREGAKFVLEFQRSDREQIT